MDAGCRASVRRGAVDQRFNTGVVPSQGAAVFTFGSLELRNSPTLNVVGDRPLVLLAHDNANQTSQIVVGTHRLLHVRRRERRCPAADDEPRPRYEWASP
jgi:hypothetical protein